MFRRPPADVIWDTRMARATGITGWEVSPPRLSALHPVSCTDDHANHRRLMHAIEDTLIGMVGVVRSCGAGAMRIDDSLP